MAENSLEIKLMSTFTFHFRRAIYQKSCANAEIQALLLLNYYSVPSLRDLQLRINVSMVKVWKPNLRR